MRSRYQTTPDATMYTLEAIHLLTRADITPTGQYVSLLATDLQAIAEEPDAPSTERAFRAAVTLLKRIGGRQNLHSYVACLSASAAVQTMLLETAREDTIDTLCG